MANSDNFITWATDPKLNIEEAFCAELLVDAGVGLWKNKNKIKPTNWLTHYEEERERKKKRCLNPVHRAQLKRIDVERAASVLDELTSLRWSAMKYSHEDRPCRDISGLRFCPNLKEINIHGSEFKDISVLADLPALEALDLWDDELTDLRPLARCQNLKKLLLFFEQPWPQMDSLENLPHLRDICWKGNLLILESFGALPHVTTAKIQCDNQWHLPLRDLHRLPAMPRLRILEMEPVWNIEGIERYPTIRNLTLGGRLRDVRPLQKLPELTHLTLRTEQLRDVSPLIGAPQLRRLIVISQHPLDFSPLIEAPRLHEIEMQRCEINKMEISTLNSVLPPWDEEFLAARPRPLSPLRFVALPHKQSLKEHICDGAPEEGTQNDPEIFQSEARWFNRRLHQRLAKLFGADWGKVDSHAGTCYGGWLTIYNLEAAERMPELLQMAREAFAECRYRWHLTVHIDLRAEWNQKYPELEEELEKKRIIDEHLAWQARQKIDQEFLERQHRAELLQQDGTKINPKDFAAPPEPEPEETDVAEDDGIDLSEHVTGREAHPLAEQMNGYATIDEEVLGVSEHWRQQFEHFMGRKAEEK